MKEFIIYFLVGLLIGIILGTIVNLQKQPIFIYGPFKIIDGDTVKQVYRDKYMDTPELKKPKVNQLKLINNSTCLHLYAMYAKNYTINHLKALQQTGEIDRYNRSIVIFYGEGQPLVLEMVSQGLAFCYYREPIDDISYQCLTLENTAKEAKIGMWSC